MHKTANLSKTRLETYLEILDGFGFVYLEPQKFNKIKRIKEELFLGCQHSDAVGLPIRCLLYLRYQKNVENTPPSLMRPKNKPKGMHFSTRRQSLHGRLEETLQHRQDKKTSDTLAVFEFACRASTFCC